MVVSTSSNAVENAGLNSLSNHLEALGIDEIENLATQLQKLQNQNQILANSIEEEKQLQAKCYPPIQNVIGNFIRHHVSPHIDIRNAEYFVLPVRTRNPKSDLVCPSAMKIFKLLSDQLKAKLNVSSVHDLATFIAGKIPPNDIFKVLGVQQSGMIEIDISEQHCSLAVNSLLKHGVLPPEHVARPEKILIDMSSPNIAKEMHVGHLRSTMIGDALAKLWSFCGHNVSKINHIGDWGTQFGMLIAYFKRQSIDVKSLPNITEIQVMYKKAKEVFDQDEAFAKQALECVTKLQNKEPEVYKIWQDIVELSMAKFNKIYDQLNIKNLETCGESFYQDMMVKLIQELSSGNLTEIDEKGRRVMYVENSDFPLILTKSDGAFTYDTSDLTALKFRIEELKADRILYVIDAGQAPHMKAVFKGAVKMGIIQEMDIDSKIKHVEFGLVLGEDKKKLKTRSGDSIKLQDLIDEAITKATESVSNKQGKNAVEQNQTFWKDVISKMAIGGLVYQDLCNRRHLDYVFSFERMLNDKGNTAVYMLYAYVRIRSIIRKCEDVDKSALEKVAKMVDTPQLTESIHNDLDALKLAKILSNYSQVIQLSKESFQLNNICDYIYTLATAFSDFYNQCRIIDQNKINYSRLALCKASSLVLEKFLYILGISTVERI